MRSKTKWRTSAITIAALILLSCLTQQLSSADQGAEPKVNALLEEKGCLQCHYILGKGGLIGPPFEGIGKFRTEADIVKILTKKRWLPLYYPKGVVDPSEFMRHVKLDKKTAHEIAKYLINTPVEESFEVRGHREDDDTAPSTNLTFFSFHPKQPSEASRKGFSKYKEAGCAACHTIGGIGGHRGPDLDGIGARLNKSSITSRITGGAMVFFEGKEYQTSEYLMPPAQLSKEEVEQITEFLLTLPQKKGI